MLQGLRSGTFTVWEGRLCVHTHLLRSCWALCFLMSFWSPRAFQGEIWAMGSSSAEKEPRDSGSSSNIINGGVPSALLDTSGVLCKSPQTANEAQRLRSLSVGLNPILGTECSCKTEGLLPLVTASHVLPSPDTPGSVGPAAAMLFCIQTHQATSCEVSSGTRCLWLGTQILSKLSWDQNGWALWCRLSSFLRSSWGV